MSQVYEDEHIFAFRDVHPQAPIHVLVIPKDHIEMLVDMKEPEHTMLAGKMMLVAAKIVELEGGNTGKKGIGGYRLILNNGRDAQQEVYHVHLHVLAGSQPWKKSR